MYSISIHIVGYCKESGIEVAVQISVTYYDICYTVRTIWTFKKLYWVNHSVSFYRQDNDREKGNANDRRRSLGSLSRFARDSQHSSQGYNVYVLNYGYFDKKQY